MISKLMEIGFSEYEARIYIALIKSSPSTAYEVAKHAAVPTSKVYEVLAKLTDRGVVTEIDDHDRRRFVPLSPDDLITHHRSRLGTTLETLREELNDISTSAELTFLRSIRDYRYLIDKTKRVIEDASQTLLVSLWPQELLQLRPSLVNAIERGVQTAIVHFGPIDIPLGHTYVHPIEETIAREKGGHGLVVVADSDEVLFAKVNERSTAEGIHSISKGFVAMAEEYIRHDIYIMKLVHRFDPLLKKNFGETYEYLRDVFKDDVV
jgi:sugar-specific transcriptional regulator TrmB